MNREELEFYAGVVDHILKVSKDDNAVAEILTERYTDSDGAPVAFHDASRIFGQFRGTTDAFRKAKEDEIAGKAEIVEGLLARPVKLDELDQFIPRLNESIDAYKKVLVEKLKVVGN